MEKKKFLWTERIKERKIERKNENKDRKKERKKFLWMARALDFKHL
jgi:hypothetical protein